MIPSVVASMSTASWRPACGKDFASMKANTNQGCIASVRRMWVAITQSRCARGSSLTSSGGAVRTSVAVAATWPRIIDSSAGLLSI